MSYSTYLGLVRRSDVTPLSGGAAEAIDLSLANLADYVKAMFPVGCVMPYAGSAAPAGWALCDGASVLRAGAYAALFAVIGTTFGSADGTHFTLPDLRGRVAVGAGTGAGLTARALGGTGGEETHVLTVGELAAHQHSTAFDSLPGGAGSGPGDAVGPGSQSTGSAGSDDPHNNMQPFVVLNFIIKV